MYPLPHQLPGTQWRLVSLLGTGGHAEVYLAEHVELEHRVAVKLIQAKHSARSELIVRLRQEARILAKLRDCPTIVAVHDFGKSDDGRAYFVMDHVAGRSLRQTMNHRRRAFGIDEACTIAAEAADGLHVAHEGGIVHRDIKPENVMLSGEGRVKLVDFGVAKAMQESGLTGTHTAGGFVVGTPHYMAREQAMARPVSAQTDLYALGCVLFELITASKVFEGEPIDVIRAHARETPPTLAERLGRAVPHELETIVRGLLAKDLDRRFRKGVDVAEQLRRFLRLRPPGSTPRLVSRAPVSTNERTEIDTAFSRPTVRTPNRAANPTPREAEPTTRSVPAASLVVGVATTERCARVEATTPVAPLPTEMVRALHDVDDWCNSDTPVSPATSLMAEGITRVSGEGDAAKASHTPPRTQAKDVTERVVDAHRAALPPDDATIVYRPPQRRGAVLFLGGALAVGLCVAATVLVSVLTTGMAHDTVAGANAHRSPSIVVPPTAPSTSSDSAPIAAVMSSTVTATPPTMPTKPLTSPKPTAVVTAAAPASEASGTYANALQAYQSGDYQTAESDARKAGGGKAARLLLAQILEREGKTTTAHGIYEEILLSDPSMTAALEGLKRTGG